MCDAFLVVEWLVVRPQAFDGARNVHQVTGAIACPANLFNGVREAPKFFRDAVYG
jgi:hypothetical protein